MVKVPVPMADVVAEPPLLIFSCPAFKVIPPEKVLAPLRVSFPVPVFTMPPLPVKVPLNVMSLATLDSSAALMVTLLAADAPVDMTSEEDQVPFAPRVPE